MMVVFPHAHFSIENKKKTRKVGSHNPSVGLKTIWMWKANKQ